MRLNALGLLFLAVSACAGDHSALLGSPDYQPSAERPTGWRGDGTGCYPAATPPLEWYRRPKGAINAILVSASKPKAAGPEGQPLNMGAIREWLIAGPFDAKEHASALEEVTQPNETALQPANGEALAGKNWKPLSVSVANQSQSWSRLTLDFALAYGKDQQQEWQNHTGTLEPLVAYACTNLFSPEPQKVQLRVSGTKVQAWLNGMTVKIPSQYEGTPTIELAQGWNRLMLKAASSKSNWNASAIISPIAGGGYETKNIVWMAPMPGPSWSSPVIVGQKIFINADMGVLMCLNKADGQALWARSVTFYHATTEEERKKFPDLADKAQKLDTLMSTLHTDLNTGLSIDGSKADGNTALKNKLKQKGDLERNIMDVMKKDKAYAYWDNNRGTTTPTPVTDGKNVFVSYFGGDKGNGAHVIAAYDLEGNRIWSHYTGQLGIAEHGAHGTPALSGNYLVFGSGRLIIGFEKTTGKIAWQKKDIDLGCVGASFVPMKIGGVDMVLIPMLGLVRASDGEVIWKADLKSGIPTPVLANGVLYGIGSAGNNSSFFYAYKMDLKPTSLHKVPWKTIGMMMPGTFTDGVIGSPLVHQGLFYAVSEGAGLAVVDAQTGKGVYTKPLDALNPRITYVNLVGVCTGPTLAGKYIHIRDDQAQTLVIAPGREYKELAKNILWETGGGGGLQEAQSNPYYEGSRMYYRTQGFLYCIGEK